MPITSVKVKPASRPPRAGRQGRQLCDAHLPRLWRSSIAPTNPLAILLEASWTRVTATPPASTKPLDAEK